MKPFYLCVCLLFGTIAGRASIDDYNSRRCEELALSADRVSLRGELETGDKGVIVTDRKWIESFATALRHTRLSETSHVFGLGWMTAYFYHGEEMVLSVTPIEGYYLRAFSKKGGGDFIVTRKEWKAISDLIKQHARANQSLQPTSFSVTPRAGARVAPEKAVAEH